MRAQDVLRALSRWRGASVADCAKLVGLSEQSYYQQTRLGSFRADRMLTAIDALGYDIVFVDRNTGERWKYREPHGTLKGISEYHKYNTGVSRPLAYDGSQELFVDRKGLYFLADYAKGKIKAVTKSEAEAFADKYGAR